MPPPGQPQRRIGPRAGAWEDVPRAWLARQTFPAISRMMVRGLIARCPVCGKAPLFHGYLRLAQSCGSCGAPLGQVRADDAPPYFTIFITAHLVIALVVVTGQRTDLPVWGMVALFLPLTLAVAMLLLRPVKGATVGAMLKLGLIGERREDEAD